MKNLALIFGVYLFCFQAFGGDSQIDSFLSSIRSKNLSPIELVEKVNNFVNVEISYSPEAPGEDNWQSPLETMQLKTGDCEDYAILKYSLLRSLGYDQNSLRLIYVFMNSDGMRIPHMVLGISSLEHPEDFIILDNSFLELRLISTRPDLFPVYSFNESNNFLVTTNHFVNSTSASKLTQLLNESGIISDQQDSYTIPDSL